MRIIAAYMLAVLGGNATPDEKAIKKILNAVDIKVLHRLQPSHPSITLWGHATHSHHSNHSLVKLS
jgi:hypothetical protein